MIDEVEEITNAVKYGVLYGVANIDRAYHLINLVYEEYCPYCADDIFECFFCWYCEDMSVDDMYYTERTDCPVVCGDCRESYFTTCHHCGESIYNNDIGAYNDGDLFLCHACWRDHYTRCYCCGYTIYTDDSVSDDNTTLCQACYENEYSRCDNCDQLIPNCDTSYTDDNGYTFCNSCWEDREEEDNTEDGYDWIHQYGYTPTLKFYHSDYEKVPKYHYGIEIEIDGGIRDNFDKHITLLPSVCWCTTDGSLSYQGIEVKTHPLSLEFIRSSGKIEQFCGMAKKSGYKSHDTSTCGTHIHISRTAFIDNDHLYRFIYLFEAMWTDVVKFSRRKHNFEVYDGDINAIDNYAPRYYGNTADEKAEKVTISKVTEKVRNDRYRRHSVNVSNLNTVEVRIFRGSLNPKTIIASIELVDIFRNVSEIVQEDHIEEIDWVVIKRYANVNGYTNFVDYCMLRGL